MEKTLKKRALNLELTLSEVRQQVFALQRVRDAIHNELESQDIELARRRDRVTELETQVEQLQRALHTLQQERDAELTAWDAHPPALLCGTDSHDTDGTPSSPVVLNAVVSHHLHHGIRGGGSTSRPLSGMIPTLGAIDANGRWVSGGESGEVPTSPLLRAAESTT
jgi:hypothetical protein